MDLSYNYSVLKYANSYVNNVSHKSVQHYPLSLSSDAKLNSRH